VADPDGVSHALAAIQSSLPPLRGVIHAAGVVDDRMLVHQQWARFERVMAAKILGSWNLHLQTRELPLDFFVLFSTVASLLGSAGQSNHAAANAYMDALASFRTKHGLPALSINWGPWADVGAAVDLGVTERLAKQGIEAIPPADGLKAFEALLLRAARDPGANPQAGVVPMLWPLYLSQGAKRQFTRLADFAERGTEPNRGDPESLTAFEAVDITASVHAARPTERRHVLSRFIQGQIAKSLGIGSPDGVDPGRAVLELGLDSLLAVEVRSALGTALGRPLPATLLFDYPTVDRLTDYLGRDVLAIEPWLASEPQETGSRFPSALETLSLLEQRSDEEVERMLAERLGSTR
jgi:acyl carrier protein